MENLVENQENRGLAAAAGGGGRGRSKAAAGGFAAVSSRPALGKELLFSIFCTLPLVRSKGYEVKILTECLLANNSIYILLNIY